MQIAQYISDLLHRHECVVIPGFGAILSRRMPAQYFENSHTIYPPKKALSFNAQIKENDGLLTNYVASVESIPYNEALQSIRNFVRMIERELDKEGQTTLSKIGRFTLSADRTLSFTPMYLVNYLPEAFGLSSQEIYQIDRATQASRVKETPVITINKDTDTPIAGWIKYAAVGAIILGLGSFVGYQKWESQKIEDQLAIELLAQEEFTKQIQEARFDVPSPLPAIKLEVATPAPVVKKYHIIAGAFREVTNADKKVKQLNKKGIPARVIGVNKFGLHNVAFNSFENRNDAINEMYRLRKMGHTGAWLLTGTLDK
jgi:hypothetical protein